MGKSVDFVKSRIDSGHCNGLENNEYLAFSEIALEKCTPNLVASDTLEKFFKTKELHYDVKLIVDSREIPIDVNVIYDPNADFEYFTMERCCCDGAIMYYIDLAEKVLSKVLHLKTCNKNKIPSDWKDINACQFTYTIGNFVLADEHGDEFATEEKPWMKSRFNVFLPIKFDFIKKG